MTELSAQPCGCDPGHKINGTFWKCRLFPDCNYGASLIAIRDRLVKPIEPNLIYDKPIKDAVWRKERPVYSGLFAYFPDALLEVAHVSFLGNKQHNPGQPLHWSRDKSADHLDALGRHLIDQASGRPIDTDHALHLAKIAWRALAELQIYLEKEPT